MQPQRNRKFCQFNKDQYCIYAGTLTFSTLTCYCGLLAILIWKTILNSLQTKHVIE